MLSPTSESPPSHGHHPETQASAAIAIFYQDPASAILVLTYYFIHEKTMTQRSNLPALELLLKTGKGVYAKGDSFSPLPLANLKKDNLKWGDGDTEDRDSMEGF